MKITVSAAGLNQTPLAWEKNFNNICSAIKQAEAAGAQILCLPELCISGYNCEDAFFSPSLRATSLQMLQKIVPLSQKLVVVAGLPLEVESEVYNCVAVLNEKKIVGFVPKQNLAGAGVHYEPRWFKPWPRGKRSQIVVNGQSYPVGDYLFGDSNFALGFEICEDAWVNDRPGKNLAGRGADLILNPSASHFAFGKLQERYDFVQRGSSQFQVAYVYSNLSGNESGRAIYDGGAIFAQNGNILATGPRLFFSECKVSTYSFELTPKPKTDLLALKLPVTTPMMASIQGSEWETGSDLKAEEFTHAIALGLFDYLRKSRSQQFVLSLSGGADSSTVAALIHYMVHFAWKELGREQFLSELNLSRDLSSIKMPSDLVKALLTCVYQSTENSSEVTRHAAAAVANEVGAEYLQFNVNDLVKSYVSLVEKGLDRKLTWEKDNLALQNIQARVRSPGIWLLANVRNGLLITTANRSEVAVGYSTMDGDTSGGLAPLAGIDKAYIRRYLVWLEKSGPKGFHPLPAMKFINCQQPTAELKPLKEKQTDEGDLMPYVVLDRIERTSIRDRLSPLETYLRLKLELSEYKPAQLAQWVEKFFTMFTRSQWKRERNAPSFHLDDESLDPKTWYRFPILSGNYQFEIQQLRDYVKGEHE